MKLRKSCSGRKENEFFITAGAALATKKATVSVFGLIFLQMCWELRMFCKRLNLKNVLW